MKPVSNIAFRKALENRGFRSIREDDPDGISREMWFKMCHRCGVFIDRFVDPDIYDEQHLGLELEVIDNLDCGHGHS